MTSSNKRMTIFYGARQTVAHDTTKQQSNKTTKQQNTRPVNTQKHLTKLHFQPRVTSATQDIFEEKLIRKTNINKDKKNQTSLKKHRKNIPSKHKNNNNNQTLRTSTTPQLDMYSKDSILSAKLTYPIPFFKNTETLLSFALAVSK